MPTANPNFPIVPNFDILIDRSALPVKIQSRVVGVTVDEDVSAPAMCVLEMEASDDPSNPTAWIDDPALFSVGSDMQVKMGYMSNLDILFQGEVTGLEPEFTTDHLPHLVARGYDRRHRLQHGRKTRTFVQQKDSDIAKQIASEAGLSPQVTDTNVTHEYILQANQSDIEFLEDRASAIRYEVVVEGKTLIFRPVPNDKSEVAKITLQDDLIEFYPRLSAMQQVSRVEVRGWDSKQKAEIVGQAQNGDEISNMGGQSSGAALSKKAFGQSIESITTYPVLTQAEADQVAKARFNDAALTLITGDGTCFGRTDIRAGKVINIAGVGRRFSGLYYVTAAVHRYTAQAGYITHFTVRRNAV